jgi:amidase
LLVGSSGGSAVAVTTNLVPIAYGTETDGSIAGPAQAVSVVGIKPTPGLTSRSGVIPCSENFDTIGTFGRTVLDAVLALDAIVSVDPSDPRSTTAEHVSGSYMDFITDKSALKGSKFGLPIKGVWDFVPEDQKKVAMKIFDGIREAGGEVIEVDYPSADERINKRGIWDWYVTHGDQVQNSNAYSNIGNMENHHKANTQS